MESACIFSNITTASWHPDRSLTFLEERITISRFMARALGVKDRGAQSNERVGGIVVGRLPARAAAAAACRQAVVDVELDAGCLAGCDARRSFIPVAPMR